jgi:hypothetical protein
VLADHVGVDVVGVDSALCAEQRPKPGRVERGPGPEDAACTNPCLRGETDRQVSHHVHRVGRDDDD